MPALIAKLSSKNDFVQQTGYFLQEPLWNLEQYDNMTTFAANK